MIDFNLTLFIQLANFIVTMVLLNILLIRPVRDIVRKRRDLASGFLHDTESFTAQAAEKMEKYEAALSLAREQGVQKRETQKSEALERETAIVARSHQDAQEFLAESRDATRASVTAVMREMTDKIPFFAEIASSRLTGKPAGSGKRK